MPKNPETIDEYLAAVNADQRAALTKLRQQIKAAAPRAEECITYGIAAFRLDGKPIAGFGAGKNHCTFFPMDGSTVAAFKEELTDYETSKGAIRFQPDKPLPAALLKKLIKARIAANEQKAPPPKKSRPRVPDVERVVASLKRLATKATRDGMARYGIPSDHAFGVPVNAIQKLARKIGRDHELALALWDTGWYEARMLAAYVDDPELVTPAQLERWCRDFDSWAICDAACFVLFDRSPHAWTKVKQWARKKDEFVKRAAFALLACLALHDKEAAEEHFAEGLLLIERAATDERNFVKKGVSWALRSIGRRSLALHEAAVKLARGLSVSADRTARWIGKDALRDLTKPAVIKRFKVRPESG